ncbi:hypothetical protein [Kurthia gibsonii]|uniref:hypothetical protein n=1 Tax=Kurthia gibsonii TaxID=33946 RepID=UPI0030182929
MIETNKTDVIIFEAISKGISELESQHQEFESVRSSYIEALEKQTNKFKEIAKKIEPIIIFLKENGYKFSDSNNEFATSEGAILAVTNEHIYCYTHGELVDKYEKYNLNKSKQIMISQALSEIKFSVAVKGLLDVLNVQKKAINQVLREHQMLIDDSESLE